jgi:lambda repressor-like predicted transcriptional regulator
MNRSPRWRHRALLMAGLAAAGLSLASLVKLSGDPDLNGSTLRERR